MSFFDDDFYKELSDDSSNVSNAESDNTNFDEVNNSSDHVENVDLEVNKRNQETFDNLMNNAKMKKDDYWDVNSPIVKIVLFILFVIIVIGLLYYIFSWFNIMK